MLQLNIIRENPQEIIDRLAIKNFNAKELVEKIISLDSKRRETQKKLDDNLAESNTIAKEIGVLFKIGKKDEANALKEKTADLKTLTKELSESLQSTEKEMNDTLVLLPNLPHPSVPKGKSCRR